MCLTIPARIIKINGNTAWVEDFNNNQKQVLIGALNKLKINDWLLINGNLAVQQIPKDEAKKIINLLK